MLEEKESIWLYCEPFSPLCFSSTGSKVAIVGRHKGCELVLPHNSVSRRHAQVSSIRGRLVVEDLKSSNGTYVNSKRISSIYPLNLGDVIRIGPYEIELRALPYNEESPFFGETNVLNFQSDKTASLAGKIEKTPLVEILQSIEFNEKTGTLYVESENKDGFFVYVSGKPVSARFDGVEGLSAILAMLGLGNGNFLITEKIESADPDLTVSITNILLEFYRFQDELTTETDVS
jgi:hypothetical protein